MELLGELMERNTVERAKKTKKRTQEKNIKKRSGHAWLDPVKDKTQHPHHVNMSPWGLSAWSSSEHSLARFTYCWWLYLSLISAFALHSTSPPPLTHPPKSSSNISWMQHGEWIRLFTCDAVMTLLRQETTLAFDWPWNIRNQSTPSRLSEQPRHADSWVTTIQRLTGQRSLALSQILVATKQTYGLSATM